MCEGTLSLSDFRESNGHIEQIRGTCGERGRTSIRRQSLEFADSIGVLHHLPDPKTPYRLLRRLGATALAERIPFAFYARYPFRVLHTDWVDGLTVPLQDYLRPDEVAAWYRDAGLVRVRIDEDWNGRALGYAGPPPASA